ncbi:MAG TPA: hypothetical protein VMV78_12640 [Thiobacillus sp.]|nr:hypothetical protein [Thiobacillus sp.]
MFHAPDAGGLIDHAVTAANHEQALNQVLDWLEARHCGQAFHAAGHRVVHGGTDYIHPVRIDEHVLSKLESLIPLSPAPAPQPGGHPRTGPAAPGLAAGRLLRYRLPPHAAAAGPAAGSA